MFEWLEYINTVHSMINDKFHTPLVKVTVFIPFRSHGWKPFTPIQSGVYTNIDVDVSQPAIIIKINYHLLANLSIILCNTGNALHDFLSGDFLSSVYRIIPNKGTTLIRAPP